MKREIQMSVQDNGEFQFTKRESSRVRMDRNKVKPDGSYSYWKLIKSFEHLFRRPLDGVVSTLDRWKERGDFCKISLMQRLTGCLGPTYRVKETHLETYEVTSTLSDWELLAAQFLSFSSIWYLLREVSPT